MSVKTRKARFRKPVAHLRCDRELVPEIKAMAAFHNVSMAEMATILVARGIAAVRAGGKL